MCRLINSLSEQKLTFWKWNVNKNKTINFFCLFSLFLSLTRSFLSYFIYYKHAYILHIYLYFDRL